MNLTPTEVAALPLEIAVAYIEGYRWFWSKHNYWCITEPSGKERSKGVGCWENYDRNTGRKNVEPRYPDVSELEYWPCSEWSEDKSIAFGLIVKYGFTIQPTTQDGEVVSWTCCRQTAYSVTAFGVANGGRLDEVICQAVLNLYVAGIIKATEPMRGEQL